MEELGEYAAVRNGGNSVSSFVCRPLKPGHKACSRAFEAPQLCYK